MSNGDQIVAGPTWPREGSRRRAGWTPGPGLRLAGGATWHLPAIGDALIPGLPRLARAAAEFRREFVAHIYRGGPKPDGLEGRLLSLVAALLRVQYRVGERTAFGLVAAAEPAGLVEMLEVIEPYLHDLLRFAESRTPAGRNAAWN